MQTGLNFSRQYDRLSHDSYDDFPVMPLKNIWLIRHCGSQQIQVYVVQTSHEDSQRCILMATDPGDLVLDPTCGSRYHSLYCRAMGAALDHN